MIHKITLAMTALACFSLQTTHAGDFFADRFRMDSGRLFPSTETTFDLYGVLKDAENKSFFESDPGVGLGVNHFFTPCLGVGMDTDIEKFDWPNHFNWSLIGRYPIEKWRLAPYVFGGFGRQFHDTAQWTGHFGGGVDYRINQKTGLFTDIRETWPDVSRDFALWRFGVRLSF